MNDDNSLPEPEQLSLATSRSLPADARLSDEAASLREGWLALGNALDSASHEMDEAALLARVKFTPPTAAAAIIDCLPPSKVTWRPVFGLALAAAALVAIMRIAAPQPVISPAGPAMVAQQATAGQTPIESHAAEAQPPPRSGWFDPLDAEIALAQVEFQQLSASSRDVDHSLSRMNERLEALSQELFRGSL